MKTVKLLLSGDIHLGRTSTRLPGSLEQDTGSAATAWHRLVDQALAQEVDLVCLSGDLIDAGNRFWEALGPVEEGVRKLGEQGITTLAVSGNHDHEVLPRLVDALGSPWLRQLGRGGAWQRHLHPGSDRPLVAVDGWSFPQTYVSQDPTRSYEPSDPGVPILVLVHGELDIPGSPYAPLDRGTMQALPVEGWILGHNHNPPGERQDNGAAPILYVGTPQALDPSEYGLHGPWIAEIGPGGLRDLRQIPGSDVRYETLRVDLTGVDQEEAFESAVLSRLEERVSEIASEAGPLRFLSLRVELAGETEIASRLPRLGANLSEMERHARDFLVGVDKTEITATTPIDLRAYAQRDTPPGILARLLLELDREEPSREVRELLADTAQKLQETGKRRDCTALSEPPRTDQETARRVLRLEARNLLNELLRQAP
jgi:DNA repair exonuclease SbcCD nuclease subunit